MSKVKFAKGEWVARDNGYYFDVHEVDEHGCYLDQVCMGVAYENKENANLIVAAPEMYNLLERLTSHDNCKKDIIHLLGEADNLLAKARGES